MLYAHTMESISRVGCIGVDNFFVCCGGYPLLEKNKYLQGHTRTKGGYCPLIICAVLYHMTSSRRTCSSPLPKILRNTGQISIPRIPFRVGSINFMQCTRTKRQQAGSPHPHQHSSSSVLLGVDVSPAIQCRKQHPFKYFVWGGRSEKKSVL